MQDLENKRGVRRQKTHNAIEKQKRIAKSMGIHHQAGMSTGKDQSHRYAKMHSLNCGDPGCAMCGNPRKFFKERTIQEKKFMQGERDYDE